MLKMEFNTLSKKNQLNLIIGSSKRKKYLKIKCLKLWAAIVKERAGYKCEFPGCSKSSKYGYKMDAHHFISRGASVALKYDVENGVCLCFIHHMRGIDSAHGGVNFAAKFIGMTKKHLQMNKRYNENWFNKLELKAQSTGQLDLELEYLYLKNEAKKYNIC